MSFAITAAMQYILQIVIGVHSVGVLALCLYGYGLHTLEHMDEVSVLANDCRIRGFLSVFHDARYRPF